MPALHLNAKYTWYNVITALLLYRASQSLPSLSRDPSPRHMKINIRSYKHKYKSGVWQMVVGVNFLDFSLVKVMPTSKKTGHKKRNPAILQLRGFITATFTIYPNATPGKPKFCRQKLKEIPQHFGTSGDSLHPGAEDQYVKEEAIPPKRHKSHPSVSTAEAKGGHVVKRRRYLIHNLVFFNLLTHSIDFLLNWSFKRKKWSWKKRSQVT